jgi:hypothetical protein
VQVRPLLRRGPSSCVYAGIDADGKKRNF